MALNSRLVRRLGIASLFLTAALAGTAGGVVFAFMGDLPAVEALEDYTPNATTRVYSRDDQLIGEFANERREVIGYEQIPEVLRQAIIAAEDGSFFRHNGIVISRMLLALVKDAVLRQRTPGRSTITQQLARGLLPESVGFRPGDRSYERKIKEVLIALQIEKRFSKAEIFTMYANNTHWGHGVNGVQAAAELYFAKPASDLTLEEAALLAGIIQSPARQSPYVNMEAALARRNYTLDRMADEGFITTQAAAEAKSHPIVTRGVPTRPGSLAPYAREFVRLHLEERYGAEAVLEAGLSVRTTIDPELQEAATRALEKQLRSLDKLKGFRRPGENLLADAADADLVALADQRWTRAPVPGAFLTAVVTAISGQTLQVRTGGWTGTIGPSGYAWTRRALSGLMSVGDVIEVHVDRLDPDTDRFSATLEQPPIIQGAVVALENDTGHVLAMVGGSDFGASQFNRVTQALRQVGSLYKPFVYLAAIDGGWTASSPIEDTPASFDAGPDQPPYEPQNYDHEFKGTITVRQALENSRNVPAIRLMDAIGPARVNAYARDLGITSPIPDVLSAAIGTGEASLMEMTSAYAAFAHEGVRMRPIVVLEVTDRDGNVLEQHRPEPREAIRADTAYVVASLLRGVVQRGTAVRAASLDWPLGGKTGTTDDYSDAWFVGFDPDITIGVWIGYDQRQPIGEGQSGSAAALPAWMDVMASWIARRRQELDTPPEFPRPSNIVIVDGEVYIAGTEPGTGAMPY